MQHGFHVGPARGGERIERMPFLIGANGTGNTTQLEAIAARCAIRPGGGQNYADDEDDRETAAISDVVDMTFPLPPSEATR